MANHTDRRGGVEALAADREAKEKLISLHVEEFAALLATARTSRGLSPAPATPQDKSVARIAYARKQLERLTPEERLALAGLL